MDMQTLRQQRDLERVRRHKMLAEIGGREVEAGFNKFRRFCKAKSLTGKRKKKFRKVLRQVNEAKASAKLALEFQRTADGLIPGGTIGNG